MSGFSDEGGDLRQCLRERNAAEKLSRELLDALKALRDACGDRDRSPSLWAADRYTEALFDARDLIAKTEAVKP